MFIGWLVGKIQFKLAGYQGWLKGEVGGIGVPWYWLSRQILAFWFDVKGHCIPVLLNTNDDGATPPNIIV